MSAQKDVWIRRLSTEAPWFDDGKRSQMQFLFVVASIDGFQPPVKSALIS